MKILVTGAKGFVGKNLIAELENRKCGEILAADRETDTQELLNMACESDFVFHLAGVNRPEKTEEFMEGNFGLTDLLLKRLEENFQKTGKKIPVLITSSIQAVLDNPYGQSKLAGENRMFEYGKKTETAVYVYRLPNVYGKWSRPNYNSAVATFCNNIAVGLPITVNDPNVVMRLVYIDDVVEEFIRALSGSATPLSQCKGKEAESAGDKAADFCGVPTVHQRKLGEIADLIKGFKKSREDLSIPNMSDAFVSSLYSTYLSFLPEDDFSYPLVMHEDERGSFTEFLRNEDRGQVSINISHPGITKGQHWHHSKNEKFLVVKGKGLIRFRKIGTDKVIEYPVSGEVLEVVDIPTGYTHSIVNVGDEDMVTVMWANEPFNPDKPDTFFEPV